MAERGRAVGWLYVTERPLPCTHAMEEVSLDTATPLVVRDVDVGSCTLSYTFSTGGALTLGSSEGENSSPAAAMIDSDSVCEDIREALVVLAVRRIDLDRASILQIAGEERATVDIGGVQRKVHFITSASDGAGDKAMLIALE